MRIGRPQSGGGGDIDNLMNGKVNTSSMAFSTRHSTYRISLAPTGRARCRKCKQTIQKGAVRLEICVFVRPGRHTLLLRCAACIDSALALTILKVYKSASMVPAAPLIDSALANFVRDRISSFSKV